MSERYYTMYSEFGFGDAHMEGRVRAYHNTMPETWDIDEAVSVASVYGLDTIVTVVE